MSLQVALEEYYVQHLQMKEQQLQQMWQQQQASLQGKEQSFSSGFAAGFESTEKQIGSIAVQRLQETPAASPLNSPVANSPRSECEVLNDSDRIGLNIANLVDDAIENSNPFERIGDYVFMTRSRGDESKEYRFENASEFQIPCKSLFESMDTPRSVDIYIKPNDNSSEFIRIAALMKSRYLFERDTPLRINESIVIPPADRMHGKGGSLMIQCSSDIVIAPKVTIKGSDNMLNAKGSSLMLMSNGDVTNQGALCCSGLGDGEGGDMYIVANAFVNNGEMKSTPDGRTFVFCREFKNNGRIAPVPEVILTPSDEVKSQNDDKNNDEKLLLPLELAVKHGNDGIVDLLLESRAFHIAVKYGRDDVVKMLYEHLVKVKRPKEVDNLMNGGYDGNGCTPLHFACMGGYEDIARYLVDTVKVDIFRKDNDNKMGMDYAVESGHQSIAEWMSQLKKDRESEQNKSQEATGRGHRKAKSSITIELDAMTDDFWDAARINGPLHYRKFSVGTKESLEDAHIADNGMIPLIDTMDNNIDNGHARTNTMDANSSAYRAFMTD